MEYIYIGDIVNTHGLKGELRIISDFDYKDQIFKPNFKFYVGQRKEEMVVKSYRAHKTYDMVMFDDVDDINEAIVYKGDAVYVNKDDLVISSFLDEELIGIDVLVNDRFVGKVSDIMASKAHKILVVTNEREKYLIPYVQAFINKIDLEKKQIEVDEIEGLINED